MSTPPLKIYEELLYLFRLDMILSDSPRTAVDITIFATSFSARRELQKDHICLYLTNHETLIGNLHYTRRF